MGAGPAGCAAAIQANKAGLRVLVLDENAKIKKSPGETLHPGIEPILQQLGVLEQVLAANFRRHYGIWLQSKRSKQFQAYGQDQSGSWKGFQVDRKTFHEILQQAVITANNSLIRHLHVDKILIDNNRVIGVHADGKPYYAKWTVDATGRHSVVAENLGLNTQLLSPSLRAWFGWQKDLMLAPELQPVFKYVKNGWNWKAPITKNRLAWVKLRISAKNGFDAKGIDVSWQYRPQCAGAGYFLLGDAAYSLDPSASHGVLKALMSGILFAHLINNHARHIVSESQIQQIYREWIHEHFTHDAHQLRDQYLNSQLANFFRAYAIAI